MHAAADTFTAGSSNSSKGDQANKNGSLTKRTLSLRYPKNKKRPILKRAGGGLSAFARFNERGGWGGGGGAVRIKLRAKKNKVFLQTSPPPPPPCIRPWECKHCNEYTKPYITEHSWQRKKIRGTSKSKTSLSRK